MEQTETPQDSRPLEDILQYRNEDVIDAFCAALAIDHEAANEIFSDLLKFLWISEKTHDRAIATIDIPILIVDEMWHTFILFTAEYTLFCKHYFGRFVHHSPITERQKKLEIESWNEEKQENTIQEKRRRYDAIYELLGRDTFIKWYFVFPEIYSPEKIRSIRRK